MERIDFRRPDDVVFRCPTCKMQRVLSPSGAALFKRLAEEPKCAKCNVVLIEEPR